MTYTELVLTAFLIPTPQSLQFAESEVFGWDLFTVAPLPNPVEYPRASASLLIVGRRLKLSTATVCTDYESTVLALRTTYLAMEGCPELVEGVWPDAQVILEVWRENKRVQERVREWGDWYQHRRGEVDEWLAYLRWHERVLDRLYEVVSPVYSLSTRRLAAKWLVKEFGREKYESGSIPLGFAHPFEN